MVRIGGGASGGGSYASGKYALQHQQAIDDERDPPVLNTWYTLLDTVEAGIIELIKYNQENTETDNKDIEWEMTIDGIVYTNPNPAALNTTDYYLTRTKNFGGGGIYFADTQNWAPGPSFVDTLGAEKASTPLHFNKFKFRYRLVTAAGTAQKLYCMIQYCLMRLVT